MKANDIRKVLILDQGNPVAGQLLQKAAEVFGTDGVQYVVLKAHRTESLPNNTPALWHWEQKKIKC